MSTDNKECTCKEFEKNHQLCPVCDKEQFDKVSGQFENAFNALRDEAVSEDRDSKLFDIIFKSLKLVDWDNGGNDGYDKYSLSAKIENEIVEYYSEQSVSEPSPSTEVKDDKQSIMSLKNGEKYVIPESDYGKAEIWRLNEIYVLFSIPYCGGQHTFEKTYHIFAINEMLTEINSWT